MEERGSDMSEFGEEATEDVGTEVESWLRQLLVERVANDVAKEEAEITAKMGFVLCEFGTHWLSNVLGVACPECGAEV